ncbi:SCO2584 family spore wall biosynthesis protein [Streptomyces sp. O3]
MPEDVGGTPFPDGGEPDDSHDRGGADEEFASVVFDEDFVRSARVHEPTAVERLVAAAQARADGHESHDGHDSYDGYEGYDADGRRHGGYGEDFYGDHYTGYGHGSELYEAPDPEEALEEGGRGRLGGARWHRTVAWVLAVLMGVGMVALAFTAVYRGASSGNRDPAPPPATTETENAPSTSSDYRRPPVSAEPRTS